MQYLTLRGAMVNRSKEFLAYKHNKYNEYLIEEQYCLDQKEEILDSPFIDKVIFLGTCSSKNEAFIKLNDHIKKENLDKFTLEINNIKIILLYLNKKYVRRVKEKNFICADIMKVGIEYYKNELAEVENEFNRYKKSNKPDRAGLLSSFITQSRTIFKVQK